MTRFKVVLLDIDGTLLLSNDAHAHAFVDAGKSLGLTADFTSIRRLIGKGGDKLIPEAFGVDAESELGKKLDEVKGEIFRSYVSSLQPTPGARELLTKLRKDGIQLVVATSAGKEDVALLLKQARVLDLIEETTSSDDAESSKPDPDIIQAALRKAGENSRVALMIGDTPYDVEAALRAGVPIITVRCGGFWKDADLRGSLSIFDDPADILAHFEFKQNMANKTDKKAVQPSGVLVTAAASIGKVAGKIVGLVSRKSTGNAVTTRRRSKKKVNASVKNKVARKKAVTTRKTSKAVKSTSRTRKP
jgi:HAD superfamily hydrolase (TIGR01549 family)